ncbi:MAG: N-6 DNA methylase [Bacilli bacterium]|nr:N-6 DNA methylase [Bacilli bacterium]MDD4388224.1 N-6 DNA methylase [Bacilli bacterium]
MKKVDKFYDLVDQATMIHYRSLKTDYLDSLLLTTRGIIHEEYDERLSDKELKELEKIYHEIYSTDILNEEVRLASQLLMVKAFKHIGFPLPLMTPDAINYIITNIVSHRYQKKQISILDTVLGTGNMLQAISNRLPIDPDLYGVESNWRLVQLARSMANLQGNAIIIYYQDAIKDIIEKVDLVIGDLDSYTVKDGLESGSKLYEKGVRYFPFLTIDIRLKNLKDNGFFIYVVDNDFFSQPESNLFQEELKTKATLMGLIVLPKTMFQVGHIGKSILIGKKCVIKNHQMLILSIGDTDKSSLEEAINNIGRMVDRF